MAKLLFLWSKCLQMYLSLNYTQSVMSKQYLMQVLFFLRL